MEGSIAVIVGLPLLASGLIATLLRRRPTAAHHVTLAITTLTALSTALLIIHPTDTFFVIAEWLPGTGTMSLNANASGLYAALATAASLILALISWPTSPSIHVVTLMALAGANAALLADHFLLRYAALEIIALCILLAPLADKTTMATGSSAQNGYLLLRLGDAGLLGAILILWHAGGTLHIDSALDTAKALHIPNSNWVAAGFVLAVWVKLGGWPFHVWSQTGQRISLFSQAWLYITVVPSLGLYLLYRITPFLAHTGLPGLITLWIGAISALLAASLTLVQSNPRTAIIYASAAQGGLSLFLASAGIKSAIWLEILVLAPLRLLLLLAVDITQNGHAPQARRIARGFFAFGCLMLMTFDLTTLWWAQENSLTSALFVAQVAAALIGGWAIRPRFQQHDTRTTTSKARGDSPGYWLRWGTLGLSSAVTLLGSFAFTQIANWAASVTHTPPLDVPTLSDLTSSLPALLVAVALATLLGQPYRRFSSMPHFQSIAQKMAEVKKELARTVKASHIIWIVEHQILENALNRSVQAIINGADIAYRFIEHKSLEGILRQTIRVALALGQRVQSWHTGKLRHNLLWVPLALTLVILAMVVAGGAP
jgi:NADH:ubiquinone oxidoreductase subunit 5 (subunit L)/multisubunit Na+/H+ antiporter MnhA subunit